MSKIWSDKLAIYWRNYVPPNRPSRFDLDICSREAENIRKKTNKHPRVLVLGSTTEYRDWGVEENCKVTVIDNSLIFHQKISHDRKYKNATESFILCDWLDMNFQKNFDIILGDLVIGNIGMDQLSLFLNNVHNALDNGGVFITKSFFRINNSDTPTFEKLVEKFNANCNVNDPYPYFAYALTMKCRDHDSWVLNFNDMFNVINEFYLQGKLDKFVLDRYRSLGWGDGSKIEFQVIDSYEWEKYVGSFFCEIKKEIGPYYWSLDFPLYICYK